jgi:hypothetical protein
LKAGFGFELIYILMAGILVFRPRGLFPARTG